MYVFLGNSGICIYMCLRVYARVGVCMYICIYVYVYVYMYVCMCIRTREYTCICICICVSVYVYMYICIRGASISTGAYVHMVTCTEEKNTGHHEIG